MESRNNGLRLPPPWITPAAGKADREVRPVITVGHRRPPAPTGPLLLSCDFGNSASYPGTGTVLNNLGTATGIVGTLTNGPVYSTANGGILTLDGTNDYVQFNDSTELMPTTGLTVIAWTRTGVADRWLIDKRFGVTPAGVGGGYAIAGGGATGVLEWGVNGRAIVSSVPVNNNTWMMLCGVWVPSSSLTLQRNNTVLATTASGVPATLGTQAAPLRWGGRSSFNVDHWNGQVAILKVFSTALTPSERLAEYNGSRARYGLPAL
jgi:hypothetical protein